MLFGGVNVPMSASTFHNEKTKAHREKVTIEMGSKEPLHVVKLSWPKTRNLALLFLKWSEAVMITPL